MKKILTIILVILVVVSLIGCNQDYLQNYKEAVEKTDGRSQGKESIKISINNDFNQENISQEIIEELNYLKNIEFEITSSFNESYSKSRAYIKYRGLGYDLNLYTGENETLVQIPIINKYIKIDSEDLGFNEDEENNFERIEGLTSKIQSEWLDLLQKEDVVKGKRDLMTTQDGDVKVDKYTISPSEEQLRLFLKKFFAVLRSEEESLKPLIQNQNGKVNVEEIVNNLEDVIDEFEKITFKNEAYIDVDGYIVKEFINIDLENYDPQPGSNSKISVKVEVENWENEAEQIIEIPEVEESDIIDLDSMENNFESFIK
ncbi:MAG TPA: hypothetical protein DHM42_07140 [Clostridiales bacterium]|jgi:hypothetical protein|nr:hypothetical protein [Clostridiales bacterium]